MPAQITLWGANGVNKEYLPANNDDDRGQELLDATNDAAPGDTVVAGPGNYKKQGPITRDGVRIHLLPGARIYSTSDGPVVVVISGTHWIPGSYHSTTRSCIIFDSLVQEMSVMNSRHVSCLPSYVVVIASMTFSLMPCHAQPAPDPSLWEPTVFNPSGQRVVPVVYYDSTTGVLGMDTRGLNRIKDTPNYTMPPGGPILHDDVGFNGFVLHCPIAGGTFLPPFDQFFDPEQGIGYATFYSGQRYTLIVNPGVNTFLRPDVYSVLQLPTGLDAAAFPLMEMAVNFGPNLGNALFPSRPNRVQIVPEPSSNLISITLFGLGCLSRSRGRQMSSRQLFSKNGEHHACPNYTLAREWHVCRVSSVK
jgi:hypothetical protein